MTTEYTPFDKSFRTKHKLCPSRTTLREQFHMALRQARTFEDVKKGSITTLDGLRKQGAERIGFVSGIITSEGAEHLDINVSRLDHYANLLRETLPFPIFCGIDLFPHELRSKLEQQPECAWNAFWMNMIKSGRISDLFMAPKWEKSTGASIAYKAGREMGLNIHYIFPNGNNRDNIILANFYVTQNGCSYRFL